MNTLNKILKLCKTCKCELHENLNGKLYVQNGISKTITRSTKNMCDILHDLRQYLQGKCVVEDNLGWLDDLDEFDYSKQTDIFDHHKYRTCNVLNNNNHYRNDNRLYL